MKKFSLPIKNALSAIAILFLANCATNEKPTMTNQTIAEQQDPFLWLEEVEGERALNWVRSQNTRSLAHIQADSRYQKFENDALAIVRATDRLTFGSFQQNYISNFWQDATHIRGIWRKADFASWKSGNPNWETILDFDALSQAEGKNWVNKGQDCLNPNDLWNSICLISLSNGGKDANEKREFDVKTKSFVQNGFFIPEAKSDTTWVDRDTLLVGTDWGQGTLTESGYPYIVKRLKRGQALAEAQEIFRGEVKDVSAGAYNIDDGQNYHFLFYRSPTFFTTISYYQMPDGNIAQLDLPLKHSIKGIRDNQLYFTIEQDWTPRGTSTKFKAGSLLQAAISSLTNTQGTLAITPIYTPQPREALQNVYMTKTGILVGLTKNVKSEVRFYNNQNGWNYRTIALPANGVAAIADCGIRQDEVFYSYNDLITPPSILYAANISEAPQTVQSQSAKFDASNLVVEQFEAKSKDGTMIPYFVVHKRGMEYNGQTPTLLYGYGGFEVSMLPDYSPYIGKLWLENGGAYVLANIRGGGEFGPEWHEAGLKTNRQVVYDDFIGIAEDIIARGITSPRRLGIMGGSNGGLLMGVMLTQRPELFNAVVVQVPLLDMLRYHKLLAGASWVDEYGSPDIPSERAWLEVLTPYQNLHARPNFPEPLFVTSTKDDRVHPGHARKYAAKMESLGMPFLYYENIDGGHSAAANLVEGAKRRAIEYTYLSEKLKD